MFAAVFRWRPLLPVPPNDDLRALAGAQALPSGGGDQGLDLTACDREPIQIPGAIQPHGLLLIADRASLTVIGGAGDIEGRLTPSWLGRPLDILLAQDAAAGVRAAEAGAAARLKTVPGRTEALDAFVSIAGDHVLITLETAPEQSRPAHAILSQLDRAGTSFERVVTLDALCARAAIVFRELTGFDRVMIYRFLDDGAGRVLGEDRDPDLPSFLNHHFPAGDIPRQARALYVRNRVRVIPDITYQPAAIRPAELAAIDLSDVSIRSVSPIHLQYLKNMGVRASASISIVQDGLLWGLIACHHMSPRDLPCETRSACSALAGGLARQVRAKEEAEVYRERIRLRTTEDAIFSRIDPEVPVDGLIERVGGDLRMMLGADGFAAVAGSHVAVEGTCPPRGALVELGRWLVPRTAAEPFVTRSLAVQYAPAAAWPERASGLLALTLHSESPVLLLWFRAEEREVMEWAGNPHKGSDADPEAVLAPRNSFESWCEEVGGRARRWTLAQIESAVRLSRRLLEARQTRRLRDLNRELGATIAEKEALIVQKDHLLGEVNHRVQNSLQLVQAFLALQERAEAGSAVAAHLQEAQRRISAVALVHRRLYQGDQVETVDLARYLEELVGEMRDAFGSGWARALTLELAPMLISADRAVNVGLILTELVINANKYAYGGGEGPVAIALEEYHDRFRLIVADQGRGPSGTREGFGTRMIQAMAQRLDGTIERFDDAPGLRVVLTAPIES